LSQKSAMGHKRPPVCAQWPNTNCHVAGLRSIAPLRQAVGYDRYLRIGIVPALSSHGSNPQALTGAST
jgi:hypothetical protein